MKKHLLLILTLFITGFVSAQLAITVLPPSDYAGNYLDFGVTSDADGVWGVPDMEIPDNAIFGTFAVARDGSATADSTACETIVNTDEITGKIAIVYRGDCNFDIKALNCQNAGAIGVLVVNRIGESIINMTTPADGGVGGQVVIPYLFIQGEPVLNWRSEIDEGVMDAFIGNKTGLFANDLGIGPNTVLRAEHFSHPRVLAQAAEEYNVLVGADIINYGTSDQSNVTLSAVITFNESVLYNETSEIAQEITSGDTVFFELPSFSQTPLSSGFYKMSYSIIYTNEDEFVSDNTNFADFMISDTLFSYGRLGKDTNEPLGPNYLRPSGATGSLTNCIHFQDPNASKVIVEGLTYSVTSDNPNGEGLIGEVVDVYLYQWDEDFDNLDDDPTLSFDNLTELTFGEYEYLEDLEAVDVYVPFEQVITLEDNVRYLFCFNHFSEFIWAGSDSPSLDYFMNLNAYLQPQFPSENDDTWTIVTATSQVPAISVNMKDPLWDAINEEAQRVEITPFPNPTANEINIPVGNYYGKTTIDVYDIAGKKVKSLNITTTSYEIIKINVSDLDNGAYIFKMNFEDGSFSNFNVIVNN
jgi:hypothetical protein